MNLNCELVTASQNLETLGRTSENYVRSGEFPGKPPPPPEDQLVLTGDILALFVYGISDHLIAREVSNIMLNTADSPEKVMQLAKDSGEEILNSMPVFVDTNQIPSQQLTQALQSTLRDNSHLVAHYSPVLQSTGVACCLLAASWLLAGWYHQAFSFRHTLNCQTTTTLRVTLQTWLTTCLMMVSVVALSHILCGCDVFLTRGDSDYIFDSLTVLVLWRFMINRMLGWSRDED